MKCKICGNKIDRKEAYKITINGKNLYHCSEQEYKEYLKAKTVKDNTYNLINDIFGRKVINTILFKEVNEISNTYPYQHIYSYLIENQQYLSRVMSRDFKSEYAQIRYFTAIIKNSLSDYKEKEPEIKRSASSEVITMKYSQQKKRRSLAEIEAEE